MIERPQFKPHFHVEIIKGEGVFLVSEIGHTVLNGRLFELVAPLINGRRSADEIALGLDGQCSTAEVYYAIVLLDQKGCLVESDQSQPPSEAAFWTIHDIDPQTATRRLAETPVKVQALGDVAIKPFLKLLKSLHVRVTEDATVGVVLTDDYLRADLQAYNQEALRNGHSWMLVKPCGSQILLGPVFRPGETGCWSCLAQRVRINRAVELFVQNMQHRAEPFPIPHATTAATQQIAYGVAATEIAKWIAQGGEKSGLDGKVLSLDVLSWQTQMHTLERQPLCPRVQRNSIETGTDRQGIRDRES